MRSLWLYDLVGGNVPSFFDDGELDWRRGARRWCVAVRLAHAGVGAYGNVHVEDRILDERAFFDGSVVHRDGMADDGASSHVHAWGQDRVFDCAVDGASFGDQTV